MNFKDLLFKLSSLDAVGSVTAASDFAYGILSKYTAAEKMDNLTVIGFLDGKSDYTLMLDAHIDQIAMVVTDIDDNGFLTVSNAGGIDIRNLPSREVLVHGKENITAVFCATPPHLAKGEETFDSISDIKLDTSLGKKAKELISLGLLGVKLHPDIQNFKIDDYRCLKIYELCEKYNLPILMHTGDDRYDNSNPNRLLPVMEIYTDLTVIGAHFGGYSIWEEASEKLCELPNLYVDTCSAFFALEKETALKIIRRYGADKVIFATDYPMWRQKDELDYILSLGLTDDELEKIFSKNILKVLGVRKQEPGTGD